MEYSHLVTLSGASASRRRVAPAARSQPRLRRRGRRPALVIGELNVDLIAAGLERAPQLGMEIEARTFEMVLGSASAIFASGLCRLGHPVSFVGKVGDDYFGELCRSELSARGIDTSRVRTATGVSTGVTLCLSTQRDRAQVTYLGAIAELRYSDLPANVFDGFAHLHLSCFALQKGLRPAFAKLLSAAKRRGLSTSFDPNSTLIGETRKQALKLLGHVDVLFLNELEAAQLTGQRSAESAARELSTRVTRAVVKLGRKGALACRKGVVLSVPGKRIRALDTTGAGDSFAAGYISAFLEDQSEIECLTQANACGALSTQAVGGTAAQPNQAELRQFLLQGPGSKRAPTQARKHP